jgi:hypothetical protein
MNGEQQPIEESLSWKKKFKRELRIATGIFLILFGIVGIVVPVLPGWTPLGLGILLLAPKTRLSRWIRGLLKTVRHRMRARRRNRGRGSIDSAPPTE